MAAHRFLLDHVRAPGTWWTGEERVAIAAESRGAARCALCRARKASLSPSAATGRHDGPHVLPENVVDAVHRIRTDPARLSRSWFDGVIAGGLDVARYVELVGVSTLLAGLDYFARAFGVPPFPLPAPRPGEPSRHRAAGAKAGGAWVPMIAPEDATGPEKDLYGGGFVPNIMRALSLVPDEVRALRRSSGAHYVPVEQIPDPTVRRALARPQMEFVAARVSALNECFYCTTAHAALLRASSQVSGEAVDLNAVTGKVEGDAGVEHGARLIAFTDAVMGNDDDVLARERQAVRTVLSPEAFVDTCALIAAFNVVDRVADATGIPLDPMLSAASGDIREELGLARFRSSANTPGAQA